MANSSAPCLHRYPDGRHCYNSVTKEGGYCTQHRPTAWHGSVYKSSPVFIRNRPIVIARDKGKCQSCGASGANQVDHIVPKAEGGVDLLYNLQLLCEDCHKAKTQEDANRIKRDMNTGKKRTG